MIGLSERTVISAAVCWALLSVCCGVVERADVQLRSESEHAEARSTAVDPSCASRSRPAFCARAGDDAVRDLFCGRVQPAIRGLADLQRLLGMYRTAPAAPGAVRAQRALENTDSVIYDNLVLLGHSTALEGRVVSPINPRAIFFGEATVMAFQRGIQHVELATPARDANGFNFYLLEFEQACNRTAAGCRPGDLYTPRIEASWQGITVRDDEDLKNHALDCRQCHRRRREDSMLLMRELIGPWTHFFESDVEVESSASLPGARGRDLVQDYLRAKGDEPYAGASSENVRHTVALFLQNIVEPQQPVFFDAPTIEDERWLDAQGGLLTTPRRSLSWDRAYEAFKRGEQLSLPYFEQRATDPIKQARLTDAYARYRRGVLSAEALPDLADIFPDDPQVRAEIGLDTEPEASPAEALVQACGACHNDVLDQSVSRARFSIDLARMSTAQLSLAVERIELSASAPGAMPPPEARQLDPGARTLLVAYLRRGVRSPSDDAFLARAAALGMAGGGRL